MDTKKFFQPSAKAAFSRIPRWVEVLARRELRPRSSGRHGRTENVHTLKGVAPLHAALFLAARGIPPSSFSQRENRHLLTVW
jgi:hypothetical protein